MAKHISALTSEFNGWRMQIRRRAYQRSMRLTVKPDGSLLLTAGKMIPEKAILRFLAEHTRWIEKAQLRILEERTKNPPKQFVDGEMFFFFGRLLTLRLVLSPMRTLGSRNLTSDVESAQPSLFTGVRVEDDANNIYCYLPEVASSQKLELQVRAALRKHYFERVQFHLREKLEFWSQRTGLFYRRVQLRAQKTRWGSCSGRGTISLNLKLAIAPLSVIDYVVVHELVHLAHPNHSRRFWKQVTDHLPDWESARDWLRIHAKEADFLD